MCKSGIRLEIYKQNLQTDGVPDGETDCEMLNFSKGPLQLRKDDPLTCVASAQFLY